MGCEFQAPRDGGGCPWSLGLLHTEPSGTCLTVQVPGLTPAFGNWVENCRSDEERRGRVSEGVPIGQEPLMEKSGAVCRLERIQGGAARGGVGWAEERRRVNSANRYTVPFLCQPCR